MLISFVLLGMATNAVRGVPTVDEMRLEKRQAILSDSTMVTIDGKAPLDLILLIGVAMGFAIVCLILAIVNTKRPVVGGSKLITEERARAVSELRLRGAGKRFMVEKKGRNTMQSTVSSVTANTVDSKSQLLPLGTPQQEMIQQRQFGVAGPRLANDRGSRASRGYSFYQKGAIPVSDYAPPRRPTVQRSLLSSSSMQVPILPAAQLDTGSESSSITAISPPIGTDAYRPTRSSYLHAPNQIGGPRPLPSYARPSMQRAQSSYARTTPSGHQRISSTTVGRGASSIHRNSARPYSRTDLPLPPQIIDPALGYSPDRSSPRGKLSGRAELYRSNTDPRDSVPNSRRNSFSASPVRNSSYFDGSGSDSHSNSNENFASVSHGPTPPASITTHPLQPRSQLPRTRPLAMYDLEADYEYNSTYGGNQQLTGLLNGQQASHNPKQSWRAYG